jgi:uncharacterized membrane protein YedE/YeeE
VNAWTIAKALLLKDLIDIGITVIIATAIVGVGMVLAKKKKV